MSSKPANKAPESSAATKKKRTSSKKASSTATRKKVTKSTARKKAARTSSTKKKVASRKTTGKKTATRKTAGKKTSRKGALLKDTATVTKTAADTEPKSISWMSAQATSALKAVKANQAEKGQSVLAKNKKLETSQPIDDASLIEIADGMPVDDAALIEFAAEDLQQEPVRKPAETAQETRADNSDAAVIIKEQAITANQVETPKTMSDPETPSAEALPEDTRAETPEDSTPPPPVRQQTTRWSAVLAITLVAVTLGYVYWSGDQDGTLMGAITEMYRSQDEPAATATAAPAEKESVTTLSSTETDVPDDAEMQSDNAPPAVAGDTWTPAHMPPVVTPSTPATSPGPAAAAVEQPAPESTGLAQPVPESVAEAEPVVAEPPAPEPAVVAQPAAAPQPATPPSAAPTAAAPTAAAPAAAPGGYRSQGYGYYPQSRQPAYPPQYYRQYR